MQNSQDLIVHTLNQRGRPRMDAAHKRHAATFRISPETRDLLAKLRDLMPDGDGRVIDRAVAVLADRVGVRNV